MNPIACGNGYTIVLVSNNIMVNTYSSTHQITINIPETKPRDRFKMVSAGGNHYASLDTNGCVHTFMEDKPFYHSSNHSSTDSVKIPKEAFNGMSAVMVACGQDHMIVVTADGVVWTFGKSTSGALGLRDTTQQQTPAVVDSRFFHMAKIIMVAAGLAHSMAATAEGDVYTWGCGVGGRLGLGTDEDRFEPRNIDRTVLGDVVMVAAGAGHSLAVNPVLMGGSKNRSARLGRQRRQNDSHARSVRIRRVRGAHGGLWLEPHHGCDRAGQPLVVGK